MVRCSKRVPIVFRCNKEYCSYYKTWEGNEVVHTLIVGVYVDDLTIAGAHLSSIEELKDRLSAKLTTKNLDELHYLLEMDNKRYRC